MSDENQNGATGAKPKKQILLNAFDMFTVGHLSFGQWRNPKDRAKDKRRDLTYWTDLAKLLDKGGFVGLFLADTYGPYDTRLSVLFQTSRYKGSAEPSVRTGAQWPMADPVIPVSAMAAVTKNLGFAITTSTSYEQAYVVAKRFSTLDHLTKGRFGWNIVTSWKESASKAVSVLCEPENSDRSNTSVNHKVGLPLVEHDTRYENADEYLRVLYKLWEGSWSDTALVEDAEKGIYSDYSQIRPIHHHGKFHVDAPFLTDPSPQRTPVLFQAGTSPAGIKFGSTHAEGIFVAGLSPHVVAPRVKAIREGAIAAGRDPYSVKVFAMITPIIGRDEDDARRKYDEALRHVLDVAGNLQRIHSSLYNLRYRGDDVPRLTPRNLGTVAAIGGNGAMPVGTAAQVADVFQEWIDVADVDGFNIGYVITPGSFEDAVEYLVPELRSRGLLPEPIPEGGPAPTFREQIYGPGQKGLRSDHPGYKYKYDTYEQAVAEEEAAKALSAEQKA
ncbi:Putative Luciferase-like domain-containing protein [Colletotrichum destructivum]|uniref:Luciferase-like domain-containing protein n=1 Tax=Colletotrichum destructivum TaxID=34406 RepID=A0AAX4IV27_9PEZI|nr:Putative Luciferase-like domain-containing protein [Colletotrichum destructivum]